MPMPANARVPPLRTAFRNRPWAEMILVRAALARNSKSAAACEVPTTAAPSRQSPSADRTEDAGAYAEAKRAPCEDADRAHRDRRVLRAGQPTVGAIGG